MDRCMRGIALAIVVLAWPVFAQDAADKGTEAAKPAVGDKDRAAAANLDEAKRVLEYGIDSSVLGVIAQASDNKDKRLGTEIAKQFNSLNPDVQRAAVDYFIRVEDWTPHAAVEKMLADYSNWQTPVVQTLLQFVQKEKKPASADLLKNLLEMTDASKPEIQAGAVDAIAAVGTAEQVPALLALFKKTGTPTMVRSSILKAFAVFKNAETYALLKDVASDMGEEKALRYDALASLGKHGNQESLALITKSLTASDVFERGAAINALSGFELGQVLPQYQQALRDSFWRNRVNVLRLIADKKIGQLMEPVIYIAEKDPEATVQTEACYTLAAIGAAKCWQVLETLAANEKAASAVRGSACSLLVQKHLGPSSPVLREIMQKEWTREKSWILGAVCKELALVKDPAAAAFYEKMLDHPDYEIKILAVRGIKLNGMVLLHPKMQALLKTGQPAALKSSIEDALK